MLPGADARKMLAAVVVRTDYSDEISWQAVRDELGVADRSEQDVRVGWPVLVDNVAWAGATVNDVLAAAEGEDHLSVVFVADRITLADPEHKLLAVAVTSGLDVDERQAAVEFGTEFRILPGWVAEINARLSKRNMSFEMYAEVAQQDPEKAFRGFPY
jgi:hypothetical protein